MAQRSEKFSRDGGNQQSNMLRQSDIYFGEDESGRFLPWLIAFMVYLATLSIAGLFTLNGLTQQFGAGVANSMTIQIPVTGSPTRDNARRIDVLQKLQRTKGVMSSAHIPDERVAELLSPWLGEVTRSDQLPLPQVVDVAVDRTTGIRAGDLRRLFADFRPPVVVDDHGEWLSYLVNALRSAEIVALIIVALTGLATAGTVIFTTRTGLGLQKDTITVLHFIGAKDGYIARQFAIRAAWLGLKGGIVGLAIALPTLLALRFAIGSLNFGLLPDLNLSLSGWTALTLVVPGVALIANLTAGLTVLRSLSKQF